jgi:hypothetical protein
MEGAIRALAVGALGGLPAGLIAGGVGSRIVMRIVAITAGSADQGAITDAEATVGEISAGGTIFLLLVGSFAGVVGGVVYMGVRRWVADGGRWKGLIFGLLLLTIFGSLIIEGGNVDFHKFGYAALNVPMFAALFVTFGLLVALFVDRIERMLPTRPLEAGKPVPLAVLVLGLLLLLPAMLSVGILGQGLALILLPYVLLALPIAAALIARAAGGFERLSDLRHHRGALFGASAVLALPVIAGLIMDAAALTDIFSAGD